jgi:hypothetical protein
MEVRATVPPGETGAVTPLARVSAAGKFSVDVLGLAVGSSVRATQPAELVLTTVRLPVIAAAVDGTVLPGTRVSTLGVPETKGPASPVMTRLSRARLGTSGTKRAPAESAR